MIFTMITAVFEASAGRPLVRRRMVTGFVIAGPVYAMAVLPFGAIKWADTIVDRMTLFEEVKSHGLTNAIVVVQAPSGRNEPMEESDLIRNDINSSASVLFVKAKASYYSKVAETFPERTIWLWDGQLTQLKKSGLDRGKDTDLFRHITTVEPRA